MNEQARFGLSPTTAAKAKLLSAVDVRQSIGARVLDALAAMAGEDGVVSTAEFEAVLQAAETLGSSSVSAYLALASLDQPLKPADAIASLRSATVSLNGDERNRLLLAGWALLELQGEKAISMAERYAKALGIELSQQQLESLDFGSAPPIWKAVTAQSMRRIKGRDVLARARECLRHSGNTRLALTIADYLHGKQELQSVEEITRHSRAQLATQLKAFEEKISALGRDREQRSALLEMAKELVEQIEQRVALFSSRIDLEKDEFNDEFEDLIHDAGNAFELEARDRMQSSDWQVVRFWERLGKGPFARELERRVDRVARKHSERLRQFRQEAIHFQKEYQVASGRLMARVHHSAFANLMPGLRMSTQILSSIDTAADVAVTGSVVAGVGTGVAM